MFRVMSCLRGEHDWRLVVLAATVCLLASLVAVSLFNRTRAAHGRLRRAWLMLAGALLTLATTSVQSTAMHAMQIASDSGLAFFEYVLTPATLAIAAACVAIAALGVSLVSKHGRQSAQSQHQLM